MVDSEVLKYLFEELEQEYKNISIIQKRIDYFNYHIRELQEKCEHKAITFYKFETAFGERDAAICRCDLCRKEIRINKTDPMFGLFDFR